MSNTLNIIDMKGAEVGTLTINTAFVESEKGQQAVHEAVVAYLAAERAGTASTKNRGEVAGSGKKLWKQKGTGNARIGSRRAPHRAGGGLAFGPKPRSFEKGINKKVKALALRRALWERVNAGEVVVVDEIAFDTISTKAAVQFLNAIGVGQRVLLVLDDTGSEFEALSKVFHSFSNVEGLRIEGATACNTYHMLNGKKVVFTKASFQALGERISKEA